MFTTETTGSSDESISNNCKYKYVHGEKGAETDEPLDRGQGFAEVQEKRNN